MTKPAFVITSRKMSRPTHRMPAQRIGDSTIATACSDGRKRRRFSPRLASAEAFRDNRRKFAIKHRRTQCPGSSTRCPIPKAAAEAAEILERTLIAATDALGVVKKNGRWRLPG
jgi:hypothetical protein